MNYITDTLYWISTGLLIPVIVLLILLFVTSLILIGGFFGQYLSHKKINSIVLPQIETLSYDKISEFVQSFPKNNSSLFTKYISNLVASQNNQAQIDRLLADFEIEADKDLSISKTLAKMGPILGLMGTLIPMGPALVGLSTGDIASMAYNMQVAFSTTVVGLFSSAVGFITLQVKKRWYLQDMTNLEFTAKLSNENNIQK